MSAVINRNVKAYIYVVSTRSNLAITVCRASDGKVVYVNTAGAAIWGLLDRTFRRTNDAIKILGARVLRALLYYNLDTICVYFNGVRYVSFLIMRELLYGKQVFLVNCFDISGVPHNGCSIRNNRRFNRSNNNIMR